MKTSLDHKIKKLYESWSKEAILSVEKLPQSGSDRQYFRIKSQSKKALAAYNNCQSENRAFVDYTVHFGNKNINLPQIYAQNLDNNIYLLQDLGDITLLHFLQKNRLPNGEIPAIVINKYKAALSQLALMQIKGVEGLDLSNYQNPLRFDKQNMLWDLNYFKYCFLKASKAEFDESLLEKDFHTLAEYLSEEKTNFFMFRDFQSRNIMLEKENVYFIDYQGGKLGALQYDVVSLLFQAKANLSANLRIQLLDYYIKEASRHTSINAAKFKEKYYAFVLIRTLQVLGAYGFKGYYEQKEHFISSIPFALANLDWLINNIILPVKIPHLIAVLQKMIFAAKTKK